MFLIFSLKILFSSFNKLHKIFSLKHSLRFWFIVYTILMFSSLWRMLATFLLNFIHYSFVKSMFLWIFFHAAKILIFFMWLKIDSMFMLSIRLFWEPRSDSSSSFYWLGLVRKKSLGSLFLFWVFTDYWGRFPVASYVFFMVYSLAFIAS